MIALVLAHIQDWFGKGLRVSLGLLGGLCLLFAVIGFLHPVYLCAGILMVLIVVSLLGSGSTWSQTRDIDWLKHAGVSRMGYIIARIISSQVVSIVVLLISVPILWLYGLLWGVPLWFFVVFALLGLGSSLLVAANALLATWTNMGPSVWIGLPLTLVWLIATMVGDSRDILNPLFVLTGLIQGKDLGAAVICGSVQLGWTLIVIVASHLLAKTRVQQA